MACAAPTQAPPASLKCPGLLQQVPGSWLHLLFALLPAEDKLCLFRSSKQLASLVTQHSPGWSLWLTGKRAPGTLDRAQQALTGLLAVVNNITVKVNLQDGEQPFPHALSHCIQKVVLQGPGRSHGHPAANAWLQFHNFTALTELCLSGAVDEAVVVCLCTALEAGLMPHLHHFSDSFFSIALAGQPTNTLLQRLATALGTSVRVLHIKPGMQDFTLLHCLQFFPRLQRLEIRSWCRICKRVAQQLCEHPTLTIVQLQLCTVHGDFRKYKCRSWRTLIANTPSLHQLLALPLQALQVTVFQGNAVLNSADIAAAPELLALGSKLQWAPGLQDAGSIFVLLKYQAASAESCKQLIDFLCCMTSEHQAKISLHIHNYPLAEVWRLIPLCVVNVSVHSSGSLSGPRVWDCLPLHVTGVELADSACELPQTAQGTGTLRSLVHATPRHVKTLQLEFTERQAYHADLAELRAAAPLHLQLSFRTYT